MPQPSSSYMVHHYGRTYRYARASAAHNRRLAVFVAVLVVLTARARGTFSARVRRMVRRAWLMAHRIGRRLFRLVVIALALAPFVACAVIGVAGGVR